MRRFLECLFRHSYAALSSPATQPSRMRRSRRQGQKIALRHRRLHAFAAAWSTVMHLDRFELAA
jgi:hypothetical protein